MSSDDESPELKMLPVLQNNRSSRNRRIKNVKSHQNDNNSKVMTMTFADRIGENGNAAFKKSRLSPKQGVVEEDFDTN